MSSRTSMAIFRNTQDSRHIKHIYLNNEKETVKLRYKKVYLILNACNIRQDYNRYKQNIMDELYGMNNAVMIFMLLHSTFLFQFCNKIKFDINEAKSWALYNNNNTVHP